MPACSSEAPATWHAAAPGSCSCYYRCCSCAGGGAARCACRFCCALGARSGCGCAFGCGCGCGCGCHDGSAAGPGPAACAPRCPRCGCDRGCGGRAAQWGRTCAGRLVLQLQVQVQGLAQVQPWEPQRRLPETGAQAPETQQAVVVACKAPRGRMQPGQEQAE